MNNVLHTRTDSGLLDAMNENMLGLFADMESNDEIQVFKEGNYAYSECVHDFPLFNFFFMRDSAKMGERIEARKAYATRTGKTVFTRVIPSPDHDEIQAFLHEQGFKQEATQPGMAVDLHSIEAKALPEGVQIHHANPEQLRDAIICTFKGFGLPDNTINLFVKALQANTTARYYFATLDNDEIVNDNIVNDNIVNDNVVNYNIVNYNIVATSLLIPSHGVAGIYNVATLPHARGKGLGEAITRHALLDAKALGYGVGILQSSDMGHPIYQRMGFVDVCEYHDFVYKPES